MGAAEIPNFGELLAGQLGQVPPEALPYMLSQLERTAADRYRVWADAVPEHREGLLACAAREDDIADRVEALFPASSEQRDLVASLMPDAKTTYYDVFANLSPFEQMRIQENAERQGAQAWQNLKDAYPELVDKLDALSEIELGSADYLVTILP